MCSSDLATRASTAWPRRSPSCRRSPWTAATGSSSPWPTAPCCRWPRPASRWPAASWRSPGPASCRAWRPSPPTTTRTTTAAASPATTRAASSGCAPACRSTPAAAPRRRSDLWVELAMANSPMLQMAEAGIEVARSELEVSRAGQLPRLEAFAAYDYSDNDRSGVSGYNSGSQLGLRASMPLYTGGSTQAQIRQSGFGLEVSQYDFEAQRRDTVQQVRSLFTRVSNDVETVEARAQAIVSNQNALEATRSGYEVGTRNIVDVLNAERNLFNAIADHAEARYDYVLGLLRLQQQAGLLDAESIQAINAWLEAESAVSLELPAAGNPDPVMNIGTRPQAPS